MSAHHRYGSEKLYEAAHKLAVIDAPLADRLVDAVFSLSLVREENLPPALWAEAKALVQSCKTAQPKGGEGAFSATIDAMGEVERSQLAEKIFALFMRARSI